MLDFIRCMHSAQLSCSDNIVDYSYTINSSVGFDFTMTVQRNCSNLCAVAIGTDKWGTGHVHIFFYSKDRKKKGQLLHYLVQSNLYFTFFLRNVLKSMYLLFNRSSKNSRNGQQNTSQRSSFKLWNSKYICGKKKKSKIQQESNKKKN